MTEKDFDLKAAQAELDALRARARDLEKQMVAEMRRQLRDTSFAVSRLRDLDAMVEDVRRFVDAGV